MEMVKRKRRREREREQNLKLSPASFAWIDCRPGNGQRNDVDGRGS